MYNWIMKKNLIITLIIILFCNSHMWAQQKPESDAESLYDRIIDICQNADYFNSETYFLNIKYKRHGTTLISDTSIYYATNFDDNKGFIVYERLFKGTDGKLFGHNSAVAYLGNRAKEYNNFINYLNSSGYKEIPASEQVGKNVRVLKLVYNSPLPNVRFIVAKRDTDAEVNVIYKKDNIKFQFIKLTSGGMNDLFKYEIVMSLIKEDDK
jgi:hypothetical protein